MGLFDEFIPDPTIACPKCEQGSLEHWQGKHSGNALYVWRQGVEHPVTQLGDEELRPSGDELREVRLPSEEGLWAAGGTCNSCGYHAPFTLYSIDIVVQGGKWSEVASDEPPLKGIKLDDNWIQCPRCMDAFRIGSRGLYFCEPCKRLVRKFA